MRILLFFFFTFVSFYADAILLQEDKIKTAYIVNFIKHTNWPNAEKKIYYRLVIFKDKSYFRYLHKILNNKHFSGKLIKVFHVNTIEKIKPADIVYLNEENNKHLENIANTIRGTETLLITTNSMKKHDVMINIIQEKNKSTMSFEINKSNIIYEKLAISAELLLLGGNELDVATLYRETEAAMQKTKQQAVELKALLSSQQEQLKTISSKLESTNFTLAEEKNKLAKLNSKLSQRRLEIDKQNKELITLKNNIQEKTAQSTIQSEILEQTSKQLLLAEKKRLNQEASFLETEKHNQEMLKKVAENNLILNEQKKLLFERKMQLITQNKELQNRSKTINNQQTYITITTILIVISVLVSVFLVFFYVKNKRTAQKLSKTVRYLQSTQTQLIQAEKMASLGGLVAGVAHEINTPLSIAITSNSLVLDDTKEVKEKIDNNKLTKKRMAEHINKVEKSLFMSEKALDRVNILLANFKQVAVDQEINDERELNIAHYIDEVISTLSIEMKKHHVNYNFSGDKELAIFTQPGAIAQVITNLVNNSIKHGFADRGYGDITISIHKIENNGVKFIYHDDGIGMDAQVLKNVYEPFFTTKRNQGNTGLGMNIVYNIIHTKLKGSINIKSEPGEGATFIILLPYSIKK